jgi:hypothetical protein
MTAFMPEDSGAAPYDSKAPGKTREPPPRTLPRDDYAGFDIFGDGDEVRTARQWRDKERFHCQVEGAPKTPPKSPAP